MEIFLLFVVIILMVFFETSRSSKINSLEKKLNSLENYIKNLLQAQAQKENLREKIERIEYLPFSKVSSVQKTETKEEVPAEIPDTKITPVLSDFGVTPPAIVTENVEKDEEEKEEIPAVVEPVEKITEPTPEKEEEPVIVPRVIQTPAPRKAVEPELDWYSRFRQNNPDLEKFIGENILSKVAISILVIGIAFFVKYAIDKEWINEIARVGIGILCGGIVLGFAHRLHKKFKAFSSVLVGGGIAIFYFTIGIGFHQYHIFNQTTAFVIMFLITAFSVFISVSYDRIELAALSIIGGFATPFMVSTGQGNYQVLFIYILILDCGMLVLAYLRKWSLINILAYSLTMLLYLVWLEKKVIDTPRAPYGGALLFGGLFYIVFILMNIVNNVKEKRKFDAFELSMLLSNTFIFFGEGMHILGYYHPELKGLFSGGMAIFNLVCAWLLFKKFRADEKLVYLMIGLTLTFITISVPVQLEGNYITLVWALESVLLMWLAQRSGIILYRFTSVIILVLMLLSLNMDWIEIYRQDGVIILPILLNKGFLTSVVSAFSVGATLLLLRKENHSENYEALHFAGIDFHAQKYSSFLRVVFVVLLYCSGLLELMYQLKVHLDGETAFFLVVEAYHLLFVIALNFGLSKYNHRYVTSTLQTINVLSVIIFVLGFVYLPISDFRENIIRTQMNYTGFIFHYICLAAAVYLSILIYRKTKTKEMPVNPEWITAAVATALVYVFSVELILHVAIIRLSPATDTIVSSSIEKLGEFNTLCIHVVKIGFPILWGILAFVFLSVGMKRYNKTFRISGLVLIGLILLKLFTYDIKDASEAGKIIAFIILGVVLLIISFMYQKIKALLIDDSRKKADEEHSDTTTPTE